MRRLLVGSITFLFLAALASSVRPAEARQNNAVHLSVEAGYAGHFREGRWIPLLVSVGNDGPDISGELRVESGNTLGLTSGGFSTPIDLPTKSNKQLFLYVALDVVTQSVQVELSSNGGIVQTAAVPVARLDPSDRMMAVVTESPTGSIDLSGVRGSGDSFQADWRIDNIPPNVQALQGLDVLLLTDVDTGRLTTDQRHAIEDWVTGGGHLIVSGGPNWQKTRAGVDGLIPFTANGTLTLNAVSALTTFAGTPTDTLAAGPIIVAQGQIAPGAQVLIQQDGTPLLVRARNGQGLVDYLTADPGLEPFRSWQNRTQLWFNLLTSSGPRPGWSNGLINPGSANQAADFIKGLRLPDILQIAGFLTIYIVLIGPLNYLILRRLRRLEWAWVTIPIIILITSGIAYVTGFSLRGTQATINRLSVVQVWPGVARARVEGVVGLLSPRRALYDVSAAPGLTFRMLSSDPYNTNNVVSSIEISEGTNYQALSVPVDAGLSAAFSASGYVAAPSMEGTASLVIASDGKLTARGTVHNTTNLTLTDAMILVRNTPFPIGALAPGESRPFEFEVRPLDEAVSAFGETTVSFGTSRAYGSYPARDRFLRDVLTSAFTTTQTRLSANATTAAEQELRRRQIFLGGMTSDADLGQGQGVDVYLAGWNTTSPLGVDLKDAPFSTEDTTLYLFRLPTQLQQAGSSVRLTPDLWTWAPLGSVTQRSYSPYGLYITGSGDPAQFQFNPLVQLTSISRLTIQSKRSTSSSGASVGLWDWQAGQWVDLGAQDTGAPIYTINAASDLARFVGPEGAVRVRAEPVAGSANLDRIDVMLEGQLDSSAQTQTQ